MKMGMKVMLTNPTLDPTAKRTLEENGCEVTVAPEPGISEDALISMIHEHEIAGIYVRVEKITRKVIESCPTLKVIVENGAGVDNIDVAAATECGVQVVNLPMGPVVAVSEHTVALILALGRDLIREKANTKAGKWISADRKSFPMIELAGKNVLIVGLGNIGKTVARKLRGLDMNVGAYDPYVPAEAMEEIGIQKFEHLPEALPWADVVTVHMPLTPETKHMFAEKEFRLMKNTAFFLNIGRGPITEEADLAAALKQGEIAAAAVDVYETEPAVESPLFAQENCICTAHIAGCSKYGMANLAKMGAESLMAALSGQGSYSLVNKNVLEKK